MGKNTIARTIPTMVTSFFKCSVSVKIRSVIVDEKVVWTIMAVPRPGQDDMDNPVATHRVRKLVVRHSLPELPDGTPAPWEFEADKHIVAELLLLGLDWPSLSDQLGKSYKFLLADRASRDTELVDRQGRRHHIEVEPEEMYSPRLEEHSSLCMLIVAKR